MEEQNKTDLPPINEEEFFFRAIKRSRPDCVEGGRVTSALFKEERGFGVSVDRDAQRKEEEVIAFMLNGNLSGRVKGIANFLAIWCEVIGAKISETPSNDNPYHIDIFLDQENEQRQDIQAWQLAKACNVVYEDKNMAWTGK